MLSSRRFLAKGTLLTSRMHSFPASITRLRTQRWASFFGTHAQNQRGHSVFKIEEDGAVQKPQGKRKVQNWFEEAG